MPIEIKELVIKATVSNQSKSSDAGSGTGKNSASGASGNDWKDDIVSACVEQVLQIIKDKAER